MRLVSRHDDHKENVMLCAIYARKSSGQNGLGDEAKSVTRQIEHARGYAEPRGARRERRAP